MLADLGADVLKVEARNVGDIFRHMGGYQRNGANALFMGLNRGKRSITIDLSRPEGQEVVRELAKTADVLLENFRPGVMNRLGLTPERLHSDNPRLIVASITGFGRHGPSANEPAYDTTIQGRSGIISRQRMSADGPPDAVRSFISDKVGGFVAAQSVLAALVARERGAASGQTIAVSLFDASMYYAWADALQELAFVGPEVHTGLTFAYLRMVNATTDGYVVHAAVSLEDRQRLAEAVGRKDLNEDPRYSTLAEATKPDNYARFLEEVAAAISTMATKEVISRLLDAGVPVANVAEPTELLDDPHVQATGYFTEIEHAKGGRVRHPAYPSEFSCTTPRLVRPAPLLGEHTIAVLREAGFSEDRVSDLIDAQIVGG
jgi:formyl-CoA transferase